MRFKKHLGRLLGLVLALAMLLTTAEGFTVKTSAAETKTKEEYFAYRVDCMDSKKGNSECTAVQVLSSIDGKVYIYVKNNGADKPSVKDIMGSGYKTDVAAGEEITAYGKIYWLDEIKVGNKYDIYIVFEDAAGNTYGAYTIKKWNASYFPAGNGTKKKPYQIWTDRHLYNVGKYTGENYKKTYFKVMQDIDLAESGYSGRVCSYASTFYGNFNGNKKTIRHLKGNIFDNLESTAVVQNVFLADIDSTIISNGVDGILAEENKGLIKGCVVYNSKISNSSPTGIIVGSNREYGIVQNCASIGCEMKVYSDVGGGIVGDNAGTVENCYSKITIDSYNAGGIAGTIRGAGKVIGCLADPTFTYVVTGGKPYQGGIAGNIMASSGTIENCRSLYAPADPEQYCHYASIVASTGEGQGHHHVDNLINNIGAVKYGEITLNEKELQDYTTDARRESELKLKQLLWTTHHGDTVTGADKAVIPLKKTIAAVNVKGKNKVSISNLSFKVSHGFENETKALNKKFPFTEKKLTVPVFSTPAVVNIKKVKVDSKNDKVTITWDKVKNAEGYIVYFAKWEKSTLGGKYCEYEIEKTIDSANATEYTDSYLYPDKVYYYRVRAYWTVNGVKVYGPFSDVQEVKLAED